MNETRCDKCGVIFDKTDLAQVITHAHIEGVSADSFLVGSKGELSSPESLEEAFFKPPAESTKKTPLDRYGKCPNEECKMDWNGGDILLWLRGLGVLSDKSEEELVNIAYQSYGYVKSNPKNFSKVIAVQVVNDKPQEAGVIPTPDFYMCPNCRQVWEADTGQLFSSLHAAKNNKFYELGSIKFFDGLEVEAVEGLDD